ncbi:MAG: hypothetical protein UZ03_NOB001002271 [Nitrospira sp. OLB3]|nr:MAG: hypothetical protein UZ03_NOB001002271 [Nitrospira sp. OLB3]MCE7967046.1 DUF488 family protein [Nitrospira sp. NTP2]
MIRLKRAYSTPSPQDGLRLLVDRLWPRGCRKEALRLDGWRKNLAPSAALRTWFGHDPAKWDEFRRRYQLELDRSEQRDAIAALAQLARTTTITLVFGAADPDHNHAVVLKDVLEEAQKRLGRKNRPRN